MKGFNLTEDDAEIIYKIGAFIAMLLSKKLGEFSYERQVQLAGMVASNLISNNAITFNLNFEKYCEDIIYNAKAFYKHDSVEIKQNS